MAQARRVEDRGPYRKTPYCTEHSVSLQEYQQAGLARGATYDNRGPLRLTPAGGLYPDIAAYQAHGFYVFEQVIDATEIDALRHDVQNMIDVHRSDPTRRLTRRVDRLWGEHDPQPLPTR